LKNISAETGGTAPPVAESGSRPLLIRILSAAVLIPVAVACVWYGGVAYTAMVALFAALMIYEWNRLVGASGPLFVLQAIIVLGAVLAQPVYDVDKSLAGFAVGLAVLVVVAVLRRQAWTWSAAGAVYVAAPAIALLWLRHDAEAGAVLVAWLFVVVWMTDVGAYVAGKSLGGPKLAPKTSPNKTWSGLIGGALAAAVAGTVLIWALSGTFSLVVVAIGGFLFAVLSQMSDLVESAVKRHFHVKDSGSIIPGHGGVLDRVDGLILPAPVLALIVSMMSGSLSEWR
jgi:phosphatidate cytidylyltransferase